MRIAFMLHVFDETAAEVSITVENLLKFYSDSTLFIIYDGVPKQFHTGVIEKEMTHVKLPGKYGEFTHRYLRMFLDCTDFDYVMKVDPDTKVHRRMLSLPDPTYPTMFCRVSRSDSLPHVGALGYTRPLAKLLVENEWLLDRHLLAKYRNLPFQDPIHRELVRVKGIHVRVRHDFGWIGHESLETTFSHSGTFGPYAQDMNVPIKSVKSVDLA